MIDQKHHAFERERSGTLIRRSNLVGIKVAIVVLGMMSAFQGIGLDLVSNEHAAFAGLEPAFLYLVYFSPLVGGMFGFASTRVTSAVLAVVTAIALGIIYVASSSPDGLGLGLPTSVLVSAVAVRPALLTVVLYVLSRVEPKPIRSNA